MMRPGEDWIEALVLAGGLGTRMASITQDRLPKPMLEVRGRPFLAYHLDWLVEQGVERIDLAVHHLPEVIQGYVGASWRGVPVTYAVETVAAGTGGAIRNGLAGCDRRELVVTNGDTLFPVDLQSLLAAHRRHQADVTLGLATVPDASRYGAVEVDAEQRVHRFAEKGAPTSPWINGGVYVIATSLAPRLPAGAFSFERDLLAPHLHELAVFGVSSPAPFIDIGIPDDYRRFAEQVP